MIGSRWVEVSSRLRRVLLLWVRGYGCRAGERGHGACAIIATKASGTRTPRSGSPMMSSWKTAEKKKQTAPGWELG